MANVFLTPPTVYTGEGALQMSKGTLAGMGKKALVVTDQTMIQFGNLKKLTDILDELGKEYVVYAEINGEPSDVMIENGAALYQKEGCDFLLAMGGGSPMDAMKAIGAVVTLGQDINSFYGKTIEGEMPPSLVIPTTAGTGSEATQFTIINNTKQNIKMLLKGPSLMPKTAVIDPMFTMTAPPSVTASTGIDALCHAVEAYTSKKAFPMADTMALSAVKRIFQNLLTCYQDGKNVAARTEMATAALEAGMAFNNSSVTIIHGMSRPIGALFHVPHGLSNAMLMVKCLRFALPGCPDRFCTLAKTIGVYQDGMTDQQGAEAFLLAVAQLCSQLNIQTPAQFGIAKEEFFAQIPKMAKDAEDSGSPGNTRRTPSQEEMQAIYRSLYE